MKCPTCYSAGRGHYEEDSRTQHPIHPGIISVTFPCGHFRHLKGNMPTEAPESPPEPSVARVPIHELTGRQTMLRGELHTYHAGEWVPTRLMPQRMAAVRASFERIKAEEKKREEVDP